MNSKIVFVCLLAIGSTWAATSSSSETVPVVHEEHDVKTSGETDVFSTLLMEDKDIFPPEMIEAYEHMTPEEQQICKEVFRNNYPSEKEFITALKAESVDIGKRAEQAYNRLEEKVNRLPEEPRKFIRGLIDSGRIWYRKHLAGEWIRSENVRSFVERQYEAFKILSHESKEELMKVFPTVTRFFEDESRRETIEKLWTNEH